MKRYRRDYNCITDADVERRIEDLTMFDRINRRNVKEDFYKTYVEAERAANLAIPEDTRKIWRAQQIIKEKAYYIRLQQTEEDMVYLEKKYLEDNPWLNNPNIVRKVMSKPEDPDFYFQGQK